MDTIIPLLISTLAGLSTLIGALLTFLNIKKSQYNKFITFCLAFSISIMIGISIFDLIPESFFQYSSVYGMSKSIILLLVAFIISYIFITTLSMLIKKETKKEDLYRLGILNMIVLIFHNLPEGIASFLSTYQHLTLGIKLAFAIMLHNIPEGISIAIPIYYSTGNRKLALKNALISGMAEPLGAMLAFVFLKNFISEMMISIILIVVAGLMITLSIQELLPEALKYKENKMLYLGLLFGLLLIFINILIF